MLKVFSTTIDIIIRLLFKLLLWCITQIDLRILKNSCIPGINATWLCCMILLMYYWIWFSWYFIEVLFVCVSVCSSLILFCNFLFCDIFVLFWYHRLMVSRNEFGIIAFTAVFWHSFKRKIFKFSLNVWYNSSVKTSGHGFFFVGSFDLFSFLVFWLHNVACRILVCWPGIKPMLPPLVAWSLKHWTAS